MPLPYSENRSDCLNQGDVLERTPELSKVLASYHRHFHDQEKNRFFMVLTQSCDLERRRGATCKSRYITLAAVRSLGSIVIREVSLLANDKFNLPFPVSDSSSRQKLANFLERLANNNEPRYFFLRSWPQGGIPEDCCAILALSVPIRSSEHYEKCLEAKVSELSPVFQAKLGWLVGQTYSRVGTDDMDERDVRDLVKQTVKKAAVWIDDRRIEDAVAALTKWHSENPNDTLSQEKLQSLIEEIPDRRERVLARLRSILQDSRTIKTLMEKGHFDDTSLERIMNGIKSDQQLRTLLKD